MQPTTWQTGDRVRAFAPGRSHHGMTGVIDRPTSFPTGDMWVRLERNGMVVLCLAGELRHPMLSMGTAARTALAVWHASGGRGRERELRKLSDNVVGVQRVRRYANTLGVTLELATYVPTSVRHGAERIGDGFRQRRDACADCGEITRDRCCCAANRAEASRRWRTIGAPIPAHGDDSAEAATPEVLNERLRALLAKAGAEIR